MNKCPKCGCEKKDEAREFMFCSEALQKNKTDKRRVEQASHSLKEIFSDKFWEIIIHSKHFF